MTHERLNMRIGTRPGHRPVCHIIMANKGGVGKSTIAKSLIELVILAGMAVQAVDADIDTPDVADLLRQRDAINLSDAAGFSKLLNHIQSIPDQSAIVVSMPAGLQSRIEHHGQHFVEMLPTLNHDLGRSIAISYVIDDKLDSLQQLDGFLASCKGMPVNVIRNHFFGDDFTLFDNSETAKMIYGRGGQVIDFPALAPYIMRRLTNDRMFVSTARNVLPLGDAGELLRWWRIVSNTLTEAGYLPTQYVSAADASRDRREASDGTAQALEPTIVSAA